jgi:hypothetical protein
MDRCTCLELTREKNMIHEYHEDEEQHLNLLSCNFFVVQNIYNLMYSTTD